MAPDDEELEALLSRLESDVAKTKGPGLREVGRSLESATIAPSVASAAPAVHAWQRERSGSRKHEEQRIGPVVMRVVENPTTKSLTYHVEEPVLSERETGILRFVEETLEATLVGHPESDHLDAKRAFLRTAVERIVREYRLKLAADVRERIEYYVERDFLGYGPIDALMRDPQVEDISCDGPDIPLYIFHRRHGSMRTSVKFPEEHVLDGFIVRMAQASGKQISVASPILDATLPDRSRLQATLAREVTPRGSSFTIRRFRERPVSPVELLKWGTVSPEIAAYFWLLMEEGRSTITAGGTASGKTTSLNAWSLFIPREKKIVSIEDTREINIPHENWIAGVSRQGFGGKDSGGTVDTFKLLEAALRQRPEYIIVGEVRGQEAFTLFQAMATGHATSATMHADSAYSAVRRLENPPINVPRVMIAALDCLSVQIQVRVGGSSVRRVKEVVEFLGLDNESGELLTNTIFRWDPRTDRWMHGLKSYIMERIAESRGVPVAEMNKEWHRRAMFLDAAARRGILEYNEVADLVSAYRAFPEETYRQLMAVAENGPEEEPPL